MKQVENINDILNKYWQANTTLEEEKILRDYFNSSNVGDEHKDLIPLFSEISHYDNFELNDNFDEKLFAQLNLKPKKLKLYNYKNFLVAASAAAILIMLTTLFKPQPNAVTLSQKQQAQKAYNETLLALQVVSNKLNKGSQPVSKLSVWHEVQQKISNN